MQLKQIKKINGQITLLSGLHIGAGETEMHIGGTDNSVVSHPHTRQPYIPGSSIKGKLRSLLEMRSGLMTKTKGKPLNSKILKAEDIDKKQKEYALKILRLFGTSGSDGEDAQEIGPARAMFADCKLTEEWQAKGKELPLTEIKAETAIDRISGTAQGGSLRMTERVVAGLSFDFTISLKEMEGDPDFTSLLLEGLKLLEHDALGGSGSRGYGRVKFTFNDTEMQKRFDSIL